MHGWLSIGWLSAMLLLYLVLASYQLGLPGLHYDEAREAGQNAMELLTGAAVDAFRGASLPVLGWQLPLMVQDYIGALNVYFALPLLAFTGIGVPNLRALSVLTGVAALLFLERTVTEWMALRTQPLALLPPASSLAPSFAGLLAVTLLAASPSFVFWSRQGIFVTNLTQPFTFCCIWQGLRWLRGGQSHHLLWSALAGGLALYAKLIAAWVIVPFALLAGGWWLWQRLRRPANAPTLRWPVIIGTFALFFLPLLPLLLFNLQTEGTLSAVAGNLTTSYYGVDNRDLWANFLVRWGELWQSLSGEHLWYLGGIYANRLAPWLALAALATGLARNWRILLMPLLLLALTFAFSLFTLSALFVTHYALVQPLVIAAVAIGWSTALCNRDQPPPAPLPPAPLPLASLPPASLPLAPKQILLTGLIVLWLALDITASVRYHRALTRSGGLGDHSDASYHLAYYLQYNGLGVPIVLDWGIEAPVRYLSRGSVTPLELFGYATLATPDRDFAEVLTPLLDNPNNVYLLHHPSQTVFKGRREQLMATATKRGIRLVLAQTFIQRDGTPLYELWRRKN